MTSNKMNWLTFGVGILAYCYGFYVVYLRRTTPLKLRKLTAFKQTFGPQAGTAIHILNYTLIPILFGSMMIFAGLHGVAMF